MAPQDIQDRFLEHLEDDARHHRELAGALAQMTSSLTVLHQDMITLKRVVMSGNGQDSLLTRMRLIEESLRAGRRTAHWLLPTVIALVSVVVAIYMAHG